MSAYAAQRSASVTSPPARAAPAQPRPEVRQAVANLLTRSDAFRALSPEKQREVAQATALVADYLAVPEGIPGNQLAGGVGMPPARALADPPAAPPQASYNEASAKVDAIGDGEFEASAAREGAQVAGLLLKQVKFPTFVASLIEGVFHAIVKSSIEQMEAYTAMIASVAKSLRQFTDENVSPNQGRDHMVEKFPDLFEIGTDEFGDEPGPRLKLRDGVDEGEALRRVNSLQFEDGNVMKSMDLSDSAVEGALVMAARMQLAKQRQQLMASMVLMGINRIVITDGRISAKIMYDFTSRDSFSKKRSAQAYDYARGADGNLATTRAGEGKYDSGANVSSNYERNKEGRSSDYSADYYSKGEYKFEDKPVMTAMSAATEASDSQLQTRVQLAGAVEVNFKSDYLPLDKMATPQMIATIQGNSTPADPNVIPSAKNAPGAPAGSGTSTSAAPAAAPAA
jgi:hypothetical protein